VEEGVNSSIEDGEERAFVPIIVTEARRIWIQES
jgi:hypothetical protein